MPDKISDYPVKTVIHDDDLMDLSNTEDSGASYDQSQKLKVSAFMAYINSNVNNIYTTDDTILSNRTLDANGNFTKWLNGDVIVEEQNEAGDVSFLVQDVSSALMARLGYDNVNHSGILAVNDLSGTFLYANDGLVGFGVTTPIARIHSVGLGASNATTNLLLKNNNGVDILTALDSGFVGVGISSQSSINERFSVNGITLHKGDVFNNAVSYYRKNGGTTTGGFIYANETTNNLSIGSGFSNATEFTIGANEEIHSKIGFEGSATNIVSKVTYGGEDVISNAVRVGVDIEMTNSYFNTTSQQTKANIKYKGTDNIGTSQLDFSIAGTDILTLKDTGVLNAANLPTSSAGLVAGDIWNNLGILNIV